MGGSTDLTSRDWVAASTKQLVLSIDPTVSVEFQYYPNGGMKIFLSNISESTIGKLSFLTNTDFNNNYLYLEDLKVFINSHYSSLDIPGLFEISNSLYKQSDITAFLAGNKVKQPFAPSNIQDTSLPPGSTFNDLVDSLSGLIPYVEHTINRVKTYQIVLNPDYAGARGFNPTKQEPSPPQETDAYDPLLAQFSQAFQGLERAVGVPSNPFIGSIADALNNGFKGLTKP